MRIERHLQRRRLQRHRERHRDLGRPDPLRHRLAPGDRDLHRHSAVKSSSTPDCVTVPISFTFGAAPFTLQLSLSDGIPVPYTHCSKKLSNFGSSDFGGRYSAASRRNSSVVMSLRS